MLASKRKRDQALRNAMNRLLALAKINPVVIEYCGKDKQGQWLWQVRFLRGEFIALQGREEQVLRAIASRR
jgi:hypothetical protein